MPSRADALAEAVQKAEQDIGQEARRLHYLSVPPAAAGAIVRTLGEAGLAERARVIMEKPFGIDLASARELNEAVHEVFREDQVFRIDHFLGKEAALNMLALRFANGFLEPLWNREHIDHVQVDVPEKLSIGTRGAFYEQTGAFRDMIVTHLLQIVGVVAMEPPPSLEPRALVEEKTKVFRSLLPLDPDEVVRGQYEGYRGEPGVDPELRGGDLRRGARAASTTGAGRACRSSCARASAWPKARAWSASPSATRPSPCSRRPSGVGRAGPGPPDLRPRRHPAPLALLLRQAARARASTSRRRACSSRWARRRARARRARGLRAAHPRRDDRRPHAVHHRGGARAAVGGLRPAARRTRRRCGPTPRARGARSRSAR